MLSDRENHVSILNNLMTLREAVMCGDQNSGSVRNRDVTWQVIAIIKIIGALFYIATDPPSSCDQCCDCVSRYTYYEED
jgi:hypothetical protein